MTQLVSVVSGPKKEILPECQPMGQCMRHGVPDQTWIPGRHQSAAVLYSSWLHSGVAVLVLRKGICIRQPPVNVSGDRDEAVFYTLDTFATMEALGADYPLAVNPSAFCSSSRHLLLHLP